MPVETVNVSQDKVQEFDESKAKAWLKEKYGIEDEPDAYRQKQEAVEKSASELPKYQATLAALLREAALAEQGQQPRPAPREPIRPNETDEETKLRELSRVEPYEGTKQYFERERVKFQEEIKQTREAVSKEIRDTLSRDQEESRAFQIVSKEWPDALKRDSELFKLGQRVYQQEMTQIEKLHPHSFLIATERAAGRLGIAPTSRKSKNPAPENVTEEVESQNVERGGRRPSNPDETPTLSANDRRIAEKMKIDPKVYAKAKAARKSGKNMRSE